MMRFLLAVAGVALAAEPQADMAVDAALRKADSTIVYVKILERKTVAGDMDVVIAMGAPKEWPVEMGRFIPWTTKQKMGLFLQNRDRLYTLAIRAGSEACTVRVERIAATESVIACTADDVQSTPMNHQFVYDLGTKKLIAERSYSPFSFIRAFSDHGNAVLVGSDSQRLIAIRFRPGDPPFRVLDAGEAQPWLARVPTSKGWVGLDRKPILYVEPQAFQPVHFGAFTLEQEKGNSFGPRPVITRPGNTRYELPQSTYDAFSTARPNRVKNGYSRAGTEFEERMGPHQVDGGKLWFGKTFYDGEGDSGVGGFGYFDPGDRKYHIFSPPEVADFSVSAILVEPNTVWTALSQRGEYGGPSGGVLKYDMKTKSVRKFELPEFGGQFLRAGGDLLIATSGGVAVIHDGVLKRYFVVPTTEGGLRVVPAL